MQIAFLGLGNMGSGIAGNILAAGHDLVVWNRTASKTSDLVARGAKAAERPVDAVRGADVVFTCLMDDRSIRDHLDGDDGILAGLSQGALHICLSTISPAFAEELAERHHAHGSRFIAGPVLGRPDAAQAGELMTVLGGDLEGLDAIGELIGSYSVASIPVGERPGDAATLKLCVNYTLISTIELLGEVYALADKSGLDIEILHGLFQTIYAHPVFKMYASKLKNREFADGGFRMTGGLKDVQLMLDSARQVGAGLDIGAIIEGKMQEAIDQGLADHDWSAIYEISRRRAGLD